MRRIFGLLTTIPLVLALFIFCDLTSYERQGDDAYRQAKRLTGEKKIEAQMRAYTAYLKARDEHPKKVSVHLRNRVAEMSVARASVILDEEGIKDFLLPLISKDIDMYLTASSPADVRQAYALLLVQMADTFAGKDLYCTALSNIDKAFSYAVDRAPVAAAQSRIAAKAAKESFELARKNYESGKKEKDPYDLVNAEYNVKAALYYDSTLPGARQLLADLRKANLAIYTNFRKAALGEIADTVLFKKLDTLDIFLSISSISKGGNPVVADVHMLNHSYNAVPVKSSDFALVDAAGKRYPALTATLDPDLLDQDHQAQYKLRFPRPTGEIVKLTYTEGKHYTEKYF